jgi:hypothetical protein
MTIIEIEKLWRQAISDLLNAAIDTKTLNTLARQTSDSIRRIEIYRSYRERAIHAVNKGLDFNHTSIPFVLDQRNDLNRNNRLWILYLATYFGKSNQSGWQLFNRATFDRKKSIMLFQDIQKDLDKYFRYLASFNFFEGCSYSNHRKFTAKRLTGEKGVFESMEYFVKNINQYSFEHRIDFHSIYKAAQKIPNFGRLAVFDFASSLVKCGFDVAEPESMYGENSTGPLNAIGLLLRLTNGDSSQKAKLQLCSDLMEWFQKNSNIFMVGQVLEDAVCNWQKNPSTYIWYKG